MIDRGNVSAALRQTDRSLGVRTKSEPPPRPPVAPLKIYWRRRRSLTLQRSGVQAINIRMASLYAGAAGPMEMKVPGGRLLTGGHCRTNADIDGVVHPNDGIGVLAY